MRGFGWKFGGMLRTFLTISWVMVLLAGCAVGSGDAETPTARCTGIGMTADEIRFGLVTSDTGSASALFKGTRGGLEARIAVANAEGGVHGRRIVYEWRDDRSDAAANLIAVRELVEKVGVVSIGMGTSAATGSAEYLHSRGIPVTGPGIELVWSRHENMTSYSHMVADNQVNESWGQFARSQGAVRAVILEAVFSDTSYQLAEALRASLGRAGIEIVDSIDVTTHGNDPTSLFRRIRESGADTLVSAIPPDAFAAIYVSARAAGAPLRLGLSPNGYDRSLLTRYGTGLAGAYFAVDIVPFELPTPEHERYLAAMSEYAPYIREPRDQVALASWIYADIGIRALELAGPCPDRRAILAAIRSMHSYDANGLLPVPVDLGRQPAEVTRCYTYLRANATGTEFEVASQIPYCGEGATEG